MRDTFFLFWTGTPRPGRADLARLGPFLSSNVSPNFSSFIPQEKQEKQEKQETFPKLGNLTESKIFGRL